MCGLLVRPVMCSVIGCTCRPIRLQYDVSLLCFSDIPLAVGAILAGIVLRRFLMPNIKKDYWILVR